MLSLGRVPRAARVPADLLVDPSGAPWVTIGWIRAGVETGRIPAQPPDGTLLATDRLRLALMQVNTPRGSHCAELRAPVDRRLLRGQRLGLGSGGVRIWLLTPARPRGFSVAYGNALFGTGPNDHELVALVGPLHVRVAPIPGKPAQLC